MKQDHPQQYQRRGCDRGQALMETALIIPVLLVLILGAMDFGLLFFAQNRAEMAAAEAARLIATGQTVTTTQADIAAAFPGVSVSAAFSPSDTQGATTTVTATTTYRFVTPVLPPFFGGASQTTLTATASAMVEQAP